MIAIAAIIFTIAQISIIVLSANETRRVPRTQIVVVQSNIGNYFSSSIDVLKEMLLPIRHLLQVPQCLLMFLMNPNFSLSINIAIHRPQNFGFLLQQNSVNGSHTIRNSV